MNVILTGSTGFLGQIIKKSSASLQFTTLGRKDSDILVELSTDVPILFQTDVVIHCAGKAHSVPVTAIEKKAFFDVNVQGTKNLLKGLEKTPPQSFIFISSVSVYGLHQGEMLTEDTPLNAQDAYGKSKILAEKEVAAWCLTHGVICSILRLPLLVGPNPPGNLGAMIKGIKSGLYMNIAGGTARKSMVLAEDVARILPLVAKIGGTYNLTDGCHPSFLELSTVISSKLGKSKPINIPNWIARLAGIFGDIVGAKFPINSGKLNKISKNLTFDDSQARKVLNWRPQSVLNFLSNTNFTK